MRLQRIAFHRAVRILSGILPLLIVGFVGVAAWNYWATTRDNPTPKARAKKPLSPDVAVHTGKFSFIRNEDGKDKFTITASELTSYRDNRNFLNNVDILVHSQKEDEPDRHIHGDSCNYAPESDKDGSDVRCDGNVSVELDETTTAYTQELQYNSRTGLISSPVATRIERPGHMKGSAGDMQYFTSLGLLRLTKQADIELTEGGSLHGGVAVFQQRENWATISQGIRIESQNGWISGGSGRADLAPGTYRPTKVVVENGASMESRSPRSVLTMTSDWIQSDMTAAGKPEHVVARGKVHTENRRTSEAQKKPTDADESNAFEGTLDSPEMEAWLNDLGRFSKIDARQKPVLVGEQGTLTAEKTIHIESAGLVTTEGLSKLTGDLGIDGRDFTFSNSKDIRKFTTASRATLTSEDLVTEANTTTAILDANTRQIKSLDQAGKVILKDKKEGRNGRAGTLNFDGDKMVLGRETAGANPEVTSDQGTLKAQRITLYQKDKRFIGEGSVVMIGTNSKKEPVTVTAERADGNDDLVDYNGNVNLYPGGGQVWAEHLRFRPKQNQFEADGASRVASFGNGFKASAARMSVVDMENGLQTAHYVGDVQATRTDAQGKELVLNAQDLEVHLKSGQVSTLVAIGKVTTNQKPNRRGKGDRLDYDEATGDVILTGSNSAQAEVHDGDNVATGCKILLLKNGGRKIDQCTNGPAKLSITPNKKN